jgi:hypothetical protein
MARIGPRGKFPALSDQPPANRHSLQCRSSSASTTAAIAAGRPAWPAACRRSGPPAGSSEAEKDTMGVIGNVDTCSGVVLYGVLQGILQVAPPVSPDRKHVLIFGKVPFAKAWRFG